MAYLSKLHLVNSIIDITVIIATEFLTRCIFSSNIDRAVDPYTKQVNLFTVQGAILMLSSLALYVLHHTPYLLAFITVFILIRLLVLVLGRRSGEDSYPYSHTSQPIRYPNWPAKSKATLPVSEYRYTTSTQTFHHSAPLVENQTAAGLRVRSPAGVPRETTSKPLLKPHQEISTKSKPKFQTRSSSLLQRSPLLSSSSTVLPLSNSQTGEESGTSSSTQSFIGHKLGYFSSLFSYKRPDTTPSGMFNLGNTCFINSTLQCLIWTSGFIDSLPYVHASQVYNNDNTRLVKVLDNVVNLCRAFPDSGNDYRPVDVTELLRSISFVGPHLVTMPGTDEYQSQQDAAEFLLWLLNHLHGVLRIQSGGKSGLDIVLSDANISDLTKSKQVCLSKLHKSKSTDISLLREPLTNLSDVDWQLHWQQNSSTLYQLFLGQLIEARECQMCGKMSFSIEYFTMLPLPVPVTVKDDKHCTLDDCFKLFSKTEDMTHSNMITCSCVSGKDDTLTPGRRIALLSRPSKRLVVQLTRYSYDSSRSAAVKNTVAVRFPLTLDLFPHTMSSTIGSNSQAQPMTYELQGFCVHSGAQSTSYGHYVAYCKASTGRWYYFNDDCVSLVDIEAELTITFVLQNAYLLFYSLQDS